jgi:hypothetical protein
MLSKLNSIEQELTRRKAMYSALSYAIDDLYEIPSNGKVRRDEVHTAIEERLGIRVKKTPVRNMVIDLLIAKGVTLGSTDGKRYFRGIRCRKTKN